MDSCHSSIFTNHLYISNRCKVNNDFDRYRARETGNDATVRFPDPIWYSYQLKFLNLLSFKNLLSLLNWLENWHLRRNAGVEDFWTLNTICRNEASAKRTYGLRDASFNMNICWTLRRRGGEAPWYRETRDENGKQFESIIYFTNSPSGSHAQLQMH